jgi:hypothetical protein
MTSKGMCLILPRSLAVALALALVRMLALPLALALSFTTAAVASLIVSVLDVSFPGDSLYWMFV